MSQVRLLSFSLLIVAFCLGTAQAVKLNGKKGIGYAQAIGGPDGLSFTFGAGSLILEGILGIQHETFKDDKQDPITEFDFAGGAHFQALRIPGFNGAAFTVGGRFNIMTGKVGNEAVTQLGFDLPMRVYWFPNKYISLHTEFGFSILSGPKDGILSSTGSVQPEGTKFNIFNGDNAFGFMGMSFWWGKI